MKRGLKREYGYYLELKDGRTLSYTVDKPKDCKDDKNGMFSKADDFVRNPPPRDCVGIYIDRPGYGDSTGAKDPQTWSYGQFANDIEELADALDIQKFYALGHSSGGPCALACGAHLPDRVIGIAVLFDDPEYAAPGAPKETS